MTAGENRREFERIPKEMTFHCYVNGERFDGASIDISPSGVLLRSGDPIPLQALLMVVPTAESARRFPVMLMGRVVREQPRDREEGRAYGLMWTRCITRQGIHALYTFFSHYPEFSALTLPFPPSEAMSSQAVGYDFLRKTFYVPNIPGFGSPVTEDDVVSASLPHSPPAMHPPRRVEDLAEPDIVDVPRRPVKAVLAAERQSRTSTSRTAGAVTQALRVQHEQIPVSIPATVETGGQNSPGRIRMLSLNVLFVTLEQDLATIGTSATVQMPIPLHVESTSVLLHCNVESLAPHPQITGPGLHLTVDRVDQESRPGVFERYVKYLYYRMLTDR